jgi:protein YibB
MYTVVTGLFDIGRERWEHFQRPMSSYLWYFHNMLQFKAPMIIFCEQKFVDFVSTARRLVPFDTQIISTEIVELYMYRYKRVLGDIQKDPNYGKDHPNPTCPEIAIPDYSLVVNSKLDLLYKGSLIAKTEYCCWFDAGYTHGTIDISQIEWNPSLLYSTKDKLTMIGLKPLSFMKSEDPKEFSDQYIDLISGGFMFGNKGAIEKAHKKFYIIVHEMLMKHKIKDDDQFHWTFVAKRYPKLMNLVPGGWYSAFDLC